MNQGAITPPRGGAGRSRHELREWSGEALAELLLTPTSGGEAPYWQLSGVALEKVHQVMPALRKTLSQRGVMLFSLDPLGAHATMRTFSEVIDAYVMEVSRRLGLTDAIEELIEWMHASTRDELSAHDREVMQTDTLSRLWAALNEELPAALIVFHPERLASQVSHQLDYLMNAYFHDPIAELGPELGSPPRRRGTLAVVSEAGEGLKAFWGELVPREVDFTRHFEDEVRAYLTRPEVIRTLLETTRGDMRHLEELVTEFGANVHHLWVRRTERLPQAQRAIVEMLAAAGDIIEMNLLHDALAQLKQEGYFGANLKGLSDQGWVQRVVQMGSVRVGLSDLSLGDHMLRGFEAAQRKRLHEALYRAALEGDEQDGEASMYFVARHALEAGAIEVALEYGVRAARQLFGEGALEEAAELLDALLQYAEADILRGELHAMSADIWARLGRWRRALRHCGCLKRHVGGAEGASGARSEDRLVARQDGALRDGGEGARRGLSAV